MAKTNLSFTLTGEKIEYQRLYDLTGSVGRSMTTSGVYSFISLSSGLTYSTTTGGEYNVFLQLQTALVNYNISDTDFNTLSNQIAVLNGASGNFEKTNLSTFNSSVIYETAGGTATALTLASVILTNNYPKTFIASANNSGSATTINTKPLYKPNTTTAPTLIAGKAYTVWYSTTGVCFFIKASAEGDAVAGDVLASKKFSNDNDTGLTGTLALTGSAGVGDILAGKTAYNTDPKTQIIGMMPNLAGDSVALASSVSGTTLKLRPPTGFKDGIDDNVTITDANFDSANIIETKTIFGKPGIAKEYPIVAGVSLIHYNDTRISIPIDTLSYIKIKESRANIAGTIRVYFTLEPILGSSWNYYHQIYVNGVQRSSFADPTSIWGSSDMTYSVDLSVNNGDLIQLYVKNTTTVSIWYKNLRFGLAQPDTSTWGTVIT